ncbi:hypothetical protein BPJ_25220 [Bordetella pertussis]|uniref:hypothetical protein n=1 Tax=Bordetella pertussis TaxID=520 RepID=UPI000499206F|nr:hypothetical protein [Bordetella pertussis]BCY22130.1 hypothetical protein BPJ_25220 [Bordetella pertussis]BDT08521.1 hypothetical protein BP3J_22250 [Bordetella pertussis]
MPRRACAPLKGGSRRRMPVASKIALATAAAAGSDAVSDQASAVGVASALAGRTTSGVGSWPAIGAAGTLQSS